MNIIRQLARQLTAIVLIALFPAYSFAQSGGVTITGNVKLTGNVTLGNGSSGSQNQLGAQLPVAFTQQVCDPPSSGFPGYNNTYLVDGTHYALTVAGLLSALQTAVNAANNNPTNWEHIVVTAGQTISGSTYDANNSLITLPIPTSASTSQGCVVVESSNPPTAYEIVCTDTALSAGGILVRNPGCSPDVTTNLWTLEMLSPGNSGYHAIYACGGFNTTFGNATCGANHILWRDTEITLAPGTAQSGVSPVRAPELVKLEGGVSYIGLEYNYIHGWDPGDPGQSGQCILNSTGEPAWYNAGGVTVVPNSGTGLVNFIAPVLSSTVNSSNPAVALNGWFGPTDVVGLTNGSPLASSVFTIGGTAETIANTSTTQGVLLGTQNTQLSITTSTTLGSNTTFANSTIVESGTGPYTETVTVGGSYNPGAGNYVGMVGVSSKYNYTWQVATSSAGTFTFTSQKSLGGCTSACGTSQSVVLYAEYNPPSQYAAGCGDDVVSGIGFDATNSWALWNYTEKIHWYASESHAMSFGFAIGPFKIAHNHIESASGSLFSGGAAVDTNGGPSNDGEIRANWIGKNLAWRMLTANAGGSPPPPFGCGPLAVGGTQAMNTCPFQWAMKNDFELKLGNRVLFWGNIIDGIWSDGQSGFAIVSNPRATSGGTTGGIFTSLATPCTTYPTTGPPPCLPATIITNVTIGYNWIMDGPQGMELGTRSLGPGDGGGLSNPEDYLTIIDNVWSNMGDTGCTTSGCEGGQWGTPGTDLIDWGGFGSQEYFATIVGNGTTATATLQPIALATSTDCNGGVTPGVCPAVGVTAACASKPSDKACGVNQSAIGISRVNGSSGCPSTSPNVCMVTIEFGGRTDPMVGFNMSFSAPWTSGYQTFMVTGVDQNDPSGGSPAPFCTNTAQYEYGTQPQPCVQANGTFGDSLIYNDTSASGPTVGTICANANACAAYNVVIPTLAYSMSDINPGDFVYVPYCTGGLFTNTAAFPIVGNPVVWQAGAGTNPESLTVTFPSTVSGTDTCQLQNDAGHPYGSIFSNNTVLTPTGSSIIAGSINRQIYNGEFQHNIFATPATVSPLGWSCTTFGAEGNNSFQCWYGALSSAVAVTGGLTETDNLIVNQSGGPAPDTYTNYSNTWINGIFSTNSPGLVCVPGTTNCSPTSASGSGSASMQWTTVPNLNYCTYSTSPLNCPLINSTWGGSFALSYLVPLSGSSYQTQGANIPGVIAQEQATIFVCPSACGTPFTDEP